MAPDGIHYFEQRVIDVVTACLIFSHANFISQVSGLLPPRPLRSTRVSHPSASSRARPSAAPFAIVLRLPRGHPPHHPFGARSTIAPSLRSRAPSPMIKTTLTHRPSAPLQGRTRWFDHLRPPGLRTHYRAPSACRSQVFGPVHCRQPSVRSSSQS